LYLNYILIIIKIQLQMNIKAIKNVLCGVLILFFIGCKKKKELEILDVKPVLYQAQKQLEVQLGEAERVNGIPRTLNNDGSIYWADTNFDWTEGFFPGSCWYLFEVTK